MSDVFQKMCGNWDDENTCQELKELLDFHSKKWEQYSDEIKETPPVLSVTNSGFIYPDEHFEFEQSGDDISGYKIVERGDFAYNPSRINVGSIARQDLEEIGLVSPMYITFSLINGNPYYFYQLFKSSKMISVFDSLSTGSVRQTLNKSMFEKIHVPSPDIQQQQKIASIIYTVEQIIQKTDEIINKLDRIRIGMEQDLLSKGIQQDGSFRPDNETKFHDNWVGEIPHSWEVKRYGDLISDSSVGIVVKPSKYYNDDGRVPVLRSKNISREGITNNDLEYMTEESNAENENSKLQEGDIITVRSGDPGLSCVVSEKFDGANCVDLLISTTGPDLNPYYAALWINSSRGSKQIDRVQAGLAQQHFNLGSLRKLWIGVPPLQEQKRIIERISSIYEYLECERKYKKHLLRFKKGLTQDLHSGEVRTHKKDIKIVDEVL